MKYAELLDVFTGNVARATGYSPNDYPDWDTLGYAHHRSELLDHWSQIRSKIEHDTDKIVFINEKLAEAIASFDDGKQEPGRKLMFEIYNVLQQKKLR